MWKRQTKRWTWGRPPPTGDSVPEKATVPWVTLPAVAVFWVGVPGDQVTARELATSLRAWGKVPTIQVEQPPPAKMDKELARQL